MVVVRLLFFLLIAAAAVAAAGMLRAVIRARGRRRLLDEAHGTSCDMPETIGISLLACGVRDMEQVENLLDVEFPRYEVILTVDAQLDPSLFAAVIARYRMVGVNCTLAQELPTVGIRGLYRSRNRCFRRFVVIDKATSRPADDLDAALNAATYDHVLPLCGGAWLLPGAIERLAMELSEAPAGSIDLVRSFIGIPVTLLSREKAVAEAGFGNDPARHVVRGRRRTLHEPLMYDPDRRHGGGHWWIASAVMLAAGIALAAGFGWWMTAAALMTAAFAWCAVRLAAPSLTAGGRVVIDCREALRCILRKIGVNNFTM